MSNIFQKYGNTLPTIFNASDFIDNSIVASTITADSIYSTLINNTQDLVSSTVAIQNIDGTTSNTATITYVDSEINDLKELLLGSDELNNSLNSIAEINSAINSDPMFYQTITGNIAVKANQTSLDATNNAVNAIDTRLTSAEGTISSHTSTLSSHTTTLGSHTTTLASHTSSINTINSTLSTKANQSSLDTTNSNVSALQGKTNAMSYTGNTLTMNENIIVSLDEFLNGNTTIGNASTDLLTVNSATTFNSTVNGLTKAMIGLSNVDNTSDTNKAISSATQTALNLKANQSSLDTTNSNVSALQSKTNAMSYTGNTLTMNENIIVSLDEFLNGNCTIGNASTDLLTVNSATTFNGSVNGLTKAMVSLGNCDNTSDINKAISSATQTALNAKQNTLSWDSSPTSSSSNAISSGSVYTALGTKQNTLTFDSSPTNSSTNPVTSAGIYTALGTKPGLSSNNTMIGNQIYNIGTVTFNNGLSSNTITLNGEDLDSRLDTDEANIASNTTSIGTLNTTVSGHTTSIGTLNTTVSGHTTSIALKADDNSVVKLTGNQSISGDKTYTGNIILNGSNLNTRLTTDETNITNLQSKTNAMTYNATTNTLVMGERVIINYDENLLSNVTIGDSISDTLTINSTIVANGCNITPTELSKIDGITQNIETALNGKQATLTFDSTPTSSSTNPCTSGGIYTALGTKQATLTFDSTPTSSSTNPCTSGGIYTALGTKQATLTWDSVPTDSSNNPVRSNGIFDALALKQDTLTIDSIPTDASNNPVTSNGVYDALALKQNTLTFDSTPTSSSTNPVTSGGVYTALGTKQATLTFDSTPTSSSSNPVTSGGVYTALALKSNLSSPSFTGTPLSVTASTSDNSTQIATTAFVKAQSYAGLSSNNSFSGNNVFSSYNHVNQFGELLYNAGSGTSLSLTYTSINGLIYYSPSANYTLTLTSVPSPTSNKEVYSLTFIYDTKFYANAISVNGSSYTMKSSGGLSNISVSASATHVLQQINIVYLNSATPVVFTNVMSLY
jgi:hypothetical protein